MVDGKNSEGHSESKTATCYTNAVNSLTDVCTQVSEEKLWSI